MKCIHYRIIIYRLHGKLVCLSKLGWLSKTVKVTNNKKGNSLLLNLSIFCKLQISNILKQAPVLNVIKLFTFVIYEFSY